MQLAAELLVRNQLDSASYNALLHEQATTPERNSVLIQDECVVVGGAARQALEERLPELDAALHIYEWRRVRREGNAQGSSGTGNGRSR